MKRANVALTSKNHPGAEAHSPTRRSDKLQKDKGQKLANCKAKTLAKVSLRLKLTSDSSSHNTWSLVPGTPGALSL
ncbi:unnamed protein product, partial [Chrysoparadoxa australica]